ncbi:MAG TPA: ATP-grasp domain-containing protein [Pseudonocardiaceae bacterium]|nr:ATP-grasp domain-containing protein [Pseudonocardiaceae bacterium]
MVAVPKHVVVLVDPLRAGTKLPQLFNGLGHQCVCVLSAESPTTWWRDSLRSQDFVAVLNEEDGVEAVVDALERYEPLCIVPGGESGVLLADRLSDRFPHLPGNDPSTSTARRDKFEMAARLRHNGLAAIDGVRTGNVATATQFYLGLSEPYAVVKPLASTAADGVRFVDSEPALREVVAALVGSTDLFGRTNDEVLVQEDISRDGVEFTVNSVSSRGRHFITEVWRMHRDMMDATAVCVYSELISTADQRYRVLTDYCASVLDAVGTVNGAAHSEIMLRPAGPVLIETSSRIEGACNPATVQALLGHSQNSLLPLSYLDPNGFNRAIEYRMDKPRHARHVYLLSTRKGQVLRAPTWDRVLSLPTLVSLDSTLDTTTTLTRTTSLATCPGNLYLASDDEDAVIRDYEHFRQLEAELYEQMLTPA